MRFSADTLEVREAPDIISSDNIKRNFCSRVGPRVFIQKNSVL